MWVWIDRCMWDREDGRIVGQDAGIGRGLDTDSPVLNPPPGRMFNQYRQPPEEREGEEKEEGHGGRKPRMSVSSGQKRVGKERKTYYGRYACRYFMDLGGVRRWRANVQCIVSTYMHTRAYLVEQPHPNPLQGPALAFGQGGFEGNGARRRVAFGGGKEHGEGQRDNSTARGVAAAGGGGDMHVGDRRADRGDGIPQTDVGALCERVDEGGVAACVPVWGVVGAEGCLLRGLYAIHAGLGSPGFIKLATYRRA